MGTKAVILSRMSLSLGDSFILHEAILLIPLPEAFTLFREALAILRALQCKQRILVIVSAARNACIYYCLIAKHNPSSGQEPQLTTPPSSRVP